MTDEAFSLLAAQPSPADDQAIERTGTGLIDALSAGNWGDVATHLVSIALIVLAAGVAVYFARRGMRRYVSRATARGLGKVKDPARHTRAQLRAETLGNIMADIATATIWVVAVFVVLGEIGVSLAPLLTGAGIVGLAIGFGAQSLVRDFFSGFFILLEDQFGVGDIIQLEGDVGGLVEDISLRVTRLRALDGTVWFVPNGEIRYLGNMTKEWARALVDFQVAYHEDIDEVIEVIRTVAAQLREDDELADKILEDLEILGVEQLGDSGVVIRTYLKTLPLDKWRVARRFRQEAKRAFDERGIEIPFPHRKLVVADEEVRRLTERTVAGGRERTGRGRDGV